MRGEAVGGVQVGVFAETIEVASILQNFGLITEIAHSLMGRQRRDDVHSLEGLDTGNTGELQPKNWTGETFAGPQHHYTRLQEARADNESRP